MTMELFFTGLLQSLILALVAFGILIPFRFLNFPDLSAEGAYPLGGAVCASLLLRGMPQIFALLGGILAGGLMGIFTSQVALRLKVNSLLAGIILSTMVYSLNLRIMGKPNLSLFDVSGFHLNGMSLSLILFLAILPFALFLNTDFGLRFQTIGQNPQFTQTQGISINTYTSLGLFISGSLFGLAGGLIVHIQEFMDVRMGLGIVIHGLASLMMGESILGTQTRTQQLTAPIVGALIYQQIQGLALSMGLAPSDLKFFTGSLVLIVLAIQKGKAH